jgi:glycosyltransferase involved in cell wall biosynthesis
VSVGVAIPSIPPRTEILARALDSVAAQTRPVDAVSVAIDHRAQGATATRNRAWRALETEWIAFLDDDDEMLPQHIEKLLACAIDEAADMVYPWFSCDVGDPFPHHLGLAWEPRRPRQTTITCLWRREALEAIGGFPPHSRSKGPDGNWIGEDYLAVLALNDRGGKIVHLPERTWVWHQSEGSTCGLPERWAS